MLQRAKEVSCNNLYQRKRPTLIKEKRGTKQKRKKRKKEKKEKKKKKNRHALYAMNKKKQATHCPALLCLLLIHMGSCLSDMTLA